MIKKNSISKEKQKRLEEAAKKFQKILEKIKPYLKERKIKEYSTTGQWKTFDYGL
jgi:dynactin complex subunit